MISTRPDLILGCVQMHSELQLAANLARCIGYLDEAEARGVQLLVFPESASSRSDDPTVPPLAEDIDGEFISKLRAHLAGRDMTVIIGVTERRAGGSPYNTLVALRDGEIVGRYRKLHLYDAAGVRESESTSPGDGPVEVVEVNGFRVGMMTCYDVRFPELARLLAEKGADVLALPASWVSGPLKEEHWRTLCAARAIENTVYIVGAGQTGGNRIGRSLVAAPDGVIEVAAGYDEDLLVTRVSDERLKRVRSRFPMLGQRRFTIDTSPKPAVEDVEV